MVIIKKIDLAINGHMHIESSSHDIENDVFNVQLPTWSSSDTDLSLWKSFIFQFNLASFTYIPRPIIWHRHNNSQARPEVLNPLEKTVQLRLAEKYEKEKSVTRENLECLCANLNDAFEIFLNNKSKRVLQLIRDMILELINLIATTTDEVAKQRINDETIEKMSDFYNKITAIIESNIEFEVNRDVSSQLTEDIIAIKNTFNQERNRVLTRHADNG